MQLRNGKTYAGIAALLAVVIVALILALINVVGGDPSDASVQVYSPFGLFSPGTLAALPRSASTSMLNNLGFNSIEEYQNYSLYLVKDLGVSWVRMDFAFDGWSFADYGDYIDRLNAQGVEVVGCVLPLNNFAPADLSLFQQKFAELIKRYPFIKVWQIGNEPDLSWDYPDDYPRFFFAGQQVVRHNCANCKVALAGAGARWPGQDAEQWNRSLGLFDSYVSKISMQSPGDPKPFDIIDMHYYDFYRAEDAMLGTFREYRELPRKYGLSQDIEFWVSECATPTGLVLWPPDSPSQTEEQQASELVTRFVTMLGAQVSRVAWARFYENYRYLESEGGFFDHTGLIYNGLGDEARQGIEPGAKKQSYYAYQTLIKKLDGCSWVLRQGSGAYKFFFADEDRAPVYVLWDDGGGTSPPQSVTGPVIVTDMGGKETEATGEDLVLSPVPIFVEKQ